MKTRNHTPWRHRKPRCARGGRCARPCLRAFERSGATVSAALGAFAAHTKTSDLGNRWVTRRAPTQVSIRRLCACLLFGITRNSPLLLRARRCWLQPQHTCRLTSEASAGCSSYRRGTDAAPLHAQRMLASATAPSRLSFATTQHDTKRLHSLLLPRQSQLVHTVGGLISKQ